MRTVHTPKKSRKEYICGQAFQGGKVVGMIGGCGKSIPQGSSYKWINRGSKDLVRCNDCGFTPEELLDKTEEKVKKALEATPAVEQAEELVNQNVTETEPIIELK